MRPSFVFCFCLFVLLFAPARVDALFNCSDPVRDCSFRGVCTSSPPFDCVCQDGFVTEQPGDGPRCNYRQQSYQRAFWVNVFVGYFTGAGAFLAHLYWLGALQIFFFLCFVAQRRALSGDQDTAKVNCCKVFWGGNVLFFWVLAMALIGHNDYPDENGVPYRSWD